MDGGLQQAEKGGTAVFHHHTKRTKTNSWKNLNGFL
jgi:hypothetical protein